MIIVPIKILFSENEEGISKNYINLWILSYQLLRDNSNFDHCPFHWHCQMGSDRSNSIQIHICQQEMEGSLKSQL